MDKIKGYVEHIVFQNKENGYAVISVSNEEYETVCTGVFRFISEGEYLELTGEYVFHPKYGEQFRVFSYEAMMPEDSAAIERYLGSGAIKGIGKVTAKRIMERFGDDALRIIDEEPERLAELPGISLKKAHMIASQQAEKKDLRKALIFLGNYGISNALAVKIFKQYQNDIYGLIKENPYQLADDITGIGFRKADEIAYAAGIAPNSEFRIRSCILHVLMRAASDGNVYLPDEILKKEVLSTLRPLTVDDTPDIDEGEVEKCVMDLAVESRVIIKERDGVRQIYYTSNYYTESNIARMLHSLNISEQIDSEEVTKRLESIENEENIVLDDLQKQAVLACAGSGVLVITGGPGTGKTTTINTIIKYFEQDGMEILLAAPTGRAAKRMEEACGMEAKTIHRLLELSSEIGDTSAGARFGKNEEHPLKADVVIVDEMSMVDIYLMDALLKAIRPGTRLIMVGDSSQLPSVGAGNVLRDILDSECFNCVRLNKIFRQAEESEIITNAHKINRGEQITLRPDSRDFIFIKRDDPAVILGAILTLLRDKLPSYVGAEIRDIQVLTPVKKGALGVERINIFLQESLNPASPDKRELNVRNMIFREGDKVMHIKNNYMLEWELRTESGFVYERGSGIFNGDIGIIKKINESTQMLEVLFDDGKYVIYTFDILDELTLAYATTIHKAQGSEYPAVVLPLLTGPRLLMNRNILYTAVTRARKCVCIVGSDSTVHSMIENIREAQRFSGLKDRIIESNGRIPV